MQLSLLTPASPTFRIRYVFWLGASSNYADPARLAAEHARIQRNAS